MANVRGLFSELFAYVVLFEQMSLQGEFQPAYEQVRRDISTLLEQQETAAKRQGMTTQDFHTARFAAVAWVDETILKYIAWKHHSQWSAFPLQLEYYQTRNAGEELFERLNKLRAEQQEIREIYYLCLGLGFTGRYFLGPEDELALNRIRREQARLLSLPVEDVQDLDRLTPQPYSVPPLAGKPVQPDWTQRLLKAGLAVLVAVPLVLFLIYVFSPPPGPGTLPEKGTELRPIPPSPGTETSLEVLVRQWLEDHRGSFPCAKISVTAVEAKTKRVNLEGRVTSEAQRAEIRNGVQRIKGVSQVSDTLQIIPWPLCEAVEILEPLKEHAEAQRFGLSMRLNKPEAQPVYHKGENLIANLQTPAAFESHVYVDYYVADQGVGHLLPRSSHRTNVFRPGSLVVVGDPRVLGFTINPPFGLELITVIASKTPLFVPPRPDEESAKDYLPALRQALQKVSASEVAAAFAFITTQDRP